MKLARTALIIPALVLIAACGATTQSDSSAPSEASGQDTLVKPGGAPETAPDAGGGALAPANADGSSLDYVGSTRNAKSVDPQTKAVISKGQVSLEADDLDKARFELQKLLDTWNGSITNEESSADDEGRTDRQRLQIRVPSDRFGTAMDGISKLGKLVDRSRTSEDVTTQVIDNNARVRSQKLSLARVQALLAKAKDLNQIIAIEEQLSQRQAELDSLEQQQKYLADQTADATINVYLVATDKDDSTPADDGDGFGAGFAAGWDNLGSATSAVLKGAGAALPFTAVFALMAVPVWVVWRRRRTLS